jgi:Malic enzyme, N-terminal domain
MIGRTIAIRTNGTRVLGLGNIDPVASMPVMEGTALFYQQMQRPRGSSGRGRSRIVTMSPIRPLASAIRAHTLASCPETWGCSTRYT